MSIPDYVYPQSRLFQFLTNLAPAPVSLLKPLVIGPNYLLSRSGIETVPTVAYAAQSAPQVVAYNYVNSAGATVALPGTYEPDLAYTRLFGTDLEAVLATFSAAVKAVSAVQSNVIKVNANSFAGTGLHANLDGRAVAVGDICYVTAASKTFRRTVTALRGTTIAAHFGTNTAKDDELALGSDYNPLTRASSELTLLAVPTGISTTNCLWINAASMNAFKGTKQGALYNNEYGEEFTLTVTTAGNNTTAVVTVTSKSGKYAGTITSVAADGSSTDTAFDDAADFMFVDASGDGDILGGMTVFLNSAVVGASLTLGQVFKFSVKSQYTRLTITDDTTGTGQLIVRLKSTATAWEGARDSTFIIEVTTGTTGDTATGAVVRISDTAGLHTPTEAQAITEDTWFDLGSSGLEAKFNLAGNSPPAHNGLRKGDAYYIHAAAESESTVTFDKAVLDGPAVDTTVFTDFTANLTTVEFRLGYTGEILKTAAADATAWVAGTSGVTIDSGMALKVTGKTSPWCPFKNAIGTVSLYFRALIPPAYGEDLLIIEDPEDITTQLGTVDIDNDAAFGAAEMLKGAQGLVTCYVLRTAGVELADFNLALKKVENSRKVYALAAMTTDLDIQIAVASHCESMSGPSKKFFRRSYHGTDSPGSYPVLTAVSNAPVNATVGDYLGGGNLLVTITTAGVNVTTLGLVAGDLVKFPVLGTEYTIASILSATEIVLTTGPASPTSPAAVVELWRADTPESQIAYVRARSKALSSRRATNIWIEAGQRLVGSTMTTIPNRYVAAHVAGLRCALLPQQGLTRTEITTITSAPAMYLRYDNTLLDLAGADGTWIITQDADNGTVFVRHQLTTETDQGALAWEDSIGVNVDNISIKHDTIVNRYIGRKNVTQQTLVDLRNDLHDMLTAETQTDYGEDAGPALIRFENLRIEPDTTLKDRVKIKSKWIVPLPFNIGDQYIEVDQDDTLAVVVA